MLYNCIGLDSLDFFGDVDILHQDEALANFLTSDGMLMRQLKYHVASPLIDGLIRMRLIPSLFRNAPVVPIQDIRSNVPDILSILMESNASIRTSFNQNTPTHTKPRRCLSTVIARLRFLVKVSMTQN